MILHAPFLSQNATQCGRVMQCFNCISAPRPSPGDSPVFSRQPISPLASSSSSSNEYASMPGERTPLRSALNHDESNRSTPCFSCACSCDQFRSHEKAHLVDAPTLIFHGQKDWIVPIWHAEYLSQLLGSSVPIVAFDDCSHNDILERQNDAFFTCCKEFLDSVNLEPPDSPRRRPSSIFRSMVEPAAVQLIAD